VMAVRAIAAGPGFASRITAIEKKSGSITVCWDRPAWREDEFPRSTQILKITPALEHDNLKDTQDSFLQCKNCTYFFCREATHPGPEKSGKRLNIFVPETAYMRMVSGQRGVPLKKWREPRMDKTKLSEYEGKLLRIFHREDCRHATCRGDRCYETKPVDVSFHSALARSPAGEQGAARSPAGKQGAARSPAGKQGALRARKKGRGSGS
jgi:hypothetical protein